MNLHNAAVLMLMLYMSVYICYLASNDGVVIWYAA